MVIIKQNKGQALGKFIGSQTDVEKLPKPELPEYAFIGRSNVGKSSLINLITGNEKMAKVSSRPGKTQTINHFLINNKWYLVDLPGYGFARISKTTKKAWDIMIAEYMNKRSNVMCVFVLIDSRLPLQTIDLDFMNNLILKGVPIVIAYTKTDKLGKVALDKNLASIRKELLNHWEELPREFITSAETGAGRNEIIDFIEETNLLF